jgi:hypothetical protein
MKVPVRVALFAALAGLAPAGIAGEVVGSTFISEKDGVIEVNADGWNITDAEKAGGFPLNQIARFTVKAPIAGATPYVDLFRLANPGSQIQAEQMLKQIGDGLTAIPNAKISPIETRQIGGRRVLVLPALIAQQGVRVQGRTYMMQGDKSLYWAQVYASEQVWGQLETSVARLIESTRY